MENVTTKIIPREKNKTLLFKAGAQLLTGLGAFMLAGIGFDGDIFPFGLAFAGGTPESYLLASCLGV